MITCTAGMSLLAATSTYRLDRRRYISPRQCYLHCLCTLYCSIFTARSSSYSNSVRQSVRLSPSVSPSRRYCVKTTARSTVQFALLDSKMCLVLYKPKNIPQGRPLPPEILAPSDLPTPEGSKF